MEHTLKAEGFGLRLRPVRMGDAAFIVWLRNLDHVKGWVGDTAVDVAGQETWLKTYFQRDGDYYFIIETDSGRAVGTYGIYDLRGNSAESGRWIVRTDVPAAIPSAFMAFDLAFKELGLKELRGSTVSTNQLVLSLNRELGFQQSSLVPGRKIIGGRSVDLLQFLLSAEEWWRRHDRLLPLAQLAGRLVKEWDQTQTC